MLTGLDLCFLQSIPITEKVIKEYENTKSTDISSYITAASPLVILSLEGPNPGQYNKINCIS